MSVLPLFAPNPEDGTETFNKVKFFEATDAEGAGATLLATVDIDLTTADVADAGFTKFIHETGDLNKFYSAAYFNSVSSLQSDYGSWMQGGRSRLYRKFQSLMGDTTNSVFPHEANIQFEEDAIEALYPEVQRQEVDTSLTIDEDNLIYTLPRGFSEVTQVGVGDADDPDENFKTVKTGNWEIQEDKLRFMRIRDFNDGDTIRLVAMKKLSKIGEVPEMYDPILLLHMQGSSYRWMSARYPRFEAFSQLQTGSRVSFENLRVTADQFFNEFEKKKIALARPAGEEEYS